MLQCYYTVLVLLVERVDNDGPESGGVRNTSCSDSKQTFIRNSTGKRNRIAMRSSIKELVRLIQSEHITLVCFDFDLTISSSHTTGQLQIPVDELTQTMTQWSQQNLAKDAISLIGELHKARVHVAIVTFGDAIDNDVDIQSGIIALGGEPLIRPIMRLRLGELMDDVPIYALNPNWRNQDIDNEEKQFEDSKRWHLTQSMGHFGIRDPQNVLLIDDSANNIELASKMGFKTVKVNANVQFTCQQAFDQL